MIWWLCAAITLYTVGITVVARAETTDRLDSRRWLALLMPVTIVLATLFTSRLRLSPAVLVAAAALFIWLALPVRYVFARPPQTMMAVLIWLSGICLVDAYFLCTLGNPVLALAAGVCFVITALGHRKILGT